MSYLLGFDLSTSSLGIGIKTQDNCYTYVKEGSNQHSRDLLNNIQVLLNDHDLSLDDMDCITFCEGPGSFTGIRMASTLTQAIAYAKNIPVVTIGSLHAMAQDAHTAMGKKNTQVVISASSQMQLYSQSFIWDEKKQYMRPKDEVTLIKFSDLKNSAHSDLVTHTDTYQDLCKSKISIPLPYLSNSTIDAMLRIAYFEFKAGRSVSCFEALPQYRYNPYSIPIK